MEKLARKECKKLGAKLVRPTLIVKLFHLHIRLLIEIVVHILFTTSYTMCLMYKSNLCISKMVVLMYAKCIKYSKICHLRKQSVLDLEKKKSESTSLYI